MAKNLAEIATPHSACRERQRINTEAFLIFIQFLKLEPDMIFLVKRQDGECLDEICYQVAIPRKDGRELCYEPQHGDDRQREGEGDEQRYLVVVVELIDNHDGVDVAEGNEGNGEETQRIAALGYQVGLVGSEEHDDRLRPYPYEHAGEAHCHCDEGKRLAQHKHEGLVVALAYLDGAERLDGAADA